MGVRLLAMGAIVDTIRIMVTTTRYPPQPDRSDRVGAATQAAEAVADDSKLVLGIPLYGRNWVVSVVGTCPADAEGTVPITQLSATELIAKRGAVPVYDLNINETMFTYQLEVTDGVSTCTQNREVHYVDPAGSRARLDLARKERIGGVAFWALGFDNPETWSSVADVATPVTTQV